MALPVIVVQESIADKFVALLKKKAEAMKVGCSYDPGDQTWSGGIKGTSAESM